ncbi:hypothetical protein AB0J38_14575 [Streptomyces sp. NPDC050095]|uniref:hypothetical protein n=1 Tax=unclassified Streptomyces TaxID=2593676 RepID=UPI0034138E21
MPSVTEEDVYAWVARQSAPVKAWGIVDAFEGDDDWDVYMAIGRLKTRGRLVLWPAGYWRQIGVETFHAAHKGVHDYYYATDENAQAWNRPPYSVMWVSSDFISDTDPDAWIRGYALRGVKITGDEYDIAGIDSDDWSRYFWTGHAANASEAYATAIRSIGYDVWSYAEFETDLDVIVDMVATVQAEFGDSDPADIANEYRARRATEEAG